jgi:hypothetical protein
MGYVHGHPPAHGDNKQYLHVWDMAPDGGGKPQKLMLPAIDAKEWQQRDPDRYALHEPPAAA